ncbi:MAG: hypothetical protein M3Q19_10680 [Pseudomonadota bacterium]|nr:hypothetical protein [Pseudomonadota bacterium]
MSFIHLIRCKAPPLPQRHAFLEEIESDEIIAQSFLARPTASVPRGAKWHIGNATELHGGAVYFALGREAVVRAQEFDEGTKEFREVEQEQAPFTHGVYDRKSQTAGVLIRPGVSLNAKEVARKLEALLRSTGIADKHNATIDVDPILDPVGLIEAMRSASRITRFEFTFSLRNPPDDEKFIQRPLKEYGERVGAKEGKASLKGDSLEPEPLIELTRAVAAEGDEVIANLQTDVDKGIVRRSLKSNYLREEVEGEEEDVGSVILSAIRRAYRELRGGA